MIRVGVRTGRGPSDRLPEEQKALPALHDRPDFGQEFPPEDHVEHRMKGPEHHRGLARGDQPEIAVFHFLRRSARESHDEDPVGRHIVLFDQRADAPGNDRRLAAPRPGEHHAGPAEMEHRLPLRPVQPEIIILLRRVRPEIIRPLLPGVPFFFHGRCRPLVHHLFHVFFFYRFQFDFHHFFPKMKKAGAFSCAGPCKKVSYDSFSMAASMRRSVSSFPRRDMSSVAPPGVTARPDMAVRSGHITWLILNSFSAA